ncbi:MAG: nitrogenase iron-molybdenum cofactor biosynthesis protein NifN, partial [Roseicyclus sp.]
TGTKKSTLEDKARIAALMGDDAQTIDDGNPRRLLDLVAELEAEVLVAGGRNMYTALKARVPFLHINQEREFAYAGYAGAVELARQLALAMDAPVFAEARAPAPWKRARRAAVLATPAPTPTPVVGRSKALSVMPLKSSQTLGATLAFLGLHRSLPMLHGSQGCTAFAKVFFVQHFREPMPLQTSAVDQVSAVMGSEENLVAGLATICRSAAPQVVGLPTTALAEIQGSHVERAVRSFREAHPEHAATALIPVAAPDFRGCLETGFAKAVRAMIDTLVPETRALRARGEVRPTAQVNVLVGASLTPGDVEAVKGIIEAFGLAPFVLPDLADALDGRLVDADFSAVTVGGTRVHLVKEMGRARANLVIGASLEEAGRLLAARTGAPLYLVDHVMGLAATDHVVQVLGEIAETPVPKALERQRARLLDAMLDCHFMLATTRFGIAGDPDLVQAFADFLAESGGEVTAAVASANAPVLARVRAPEVEIGDLEDFEAAARRSDAEMLIGNSHVAASAERLGLPVLRAGFPLYDHYGGFQRTWVGYEGGRQTLFDIANALRRLERGEIPPYRSIYAAPEAAIAEDETPCPSVA